MGVSHLAGVSATWLPPPPYAQLMTMGGYLPNNLAPRTKEKTQRREAEATRGLRPTSAPQRPEAVVRRAPPLFLPSALPPPLPIPHLPPSFHFLQRTYSSRQSPANPTIYSYFFTNISFPFQCPLPPLNSPASCPSPQRFLPPFLRPAIQN